MDESFSEFNYALRRIAQALQPLFQRVTPASGKDPIWHSAVMTSNHKSEQFTKASWITYKRLIGTNRRMVNSFRRTLQTLLKFRARLTHIVHKASSTPPGFSIKWTKK